MTRSKVEATLRRKKEKASVSYILLVLKPPYAAEIVMKLYLVGTLLRSFKNFDGRRGNTREHVVCFLDPTGSYANNVDLCKRDLKISNIRTYI